MATVGAELLAKRRDRAIAVILGTKEREADPYLPKDAQAKLRKAVLDQMNDFYDLCLDLLRSVDQERNVDQEEGVVINELYLEKIGQLHDEMGEIRRLLERAS